MAAITSALIGLGASIATAVGSAGTAIAGAATAGSLMGAVGGGLMTAGAAMGAAAGVTGTIAAGLGGLAIVGGATALYNAGQRSGGGGGGGSSAASTAGSVVKALTLTELQAGNQNATNQNILGNYTTDTSGNGSRSRLLNL